MTNYLLAIDQGTTSTRAIIFSTAANYIISQHQIELKQHYPQNGWVEHDAEEIWHATLESCRQVILKANLTAKDILAIGISNQRETTLIWDKKSGQLIYPAIVWQDRRTTEFCQELLDRGLEKKIRMKTGLIIDPYFSAPKIWWLLNNVPNARIRAENGELAFGTIDSFLLWRFTKGKIHATDITNAARTLLFNIHTQSWDDELLAIFSIPKQILPEVFDCCANFGVVEKEILGAEIPITGVAGDQQAALFGQACFAEGMAKVTYGTGCFLLLNTGSKIIHSNQHLLTTIAYRIQGITAYGIEGSIFNAGAAVQWLRDSLRLIHNAKETESLAQSLVDNDGVYFVPAFTGLGAPYWDPNARAAILGLTRATGVNHIARAALEAVCYQTCDVLQIMMQESLYEVEKLRVDGGMVNNNWLMQFLADILNVTVERAAIIETSALGAVYLAGLQIGIFPSLDAISRLWQNQGMFIPKMSVEKRLKYYSGWQKAVACLL